MPPGRPKAFVGRESQILDAALRTFARHGVAATTVADIAKAGDMGVGAVYRYFGNREELFRRVVQHATFRVGEIVRLEAAGAADTLAEYEAQLHRIGDRLARLVDDEPALVRFLLEDARGIDADVDRRLDALFALFAGFTAAYLMHGKKRGYLRADLDCAVSARLINAMIFEAVRQLAPRPHAPRRTRERSRWMHAVVALLLNGVRR